MADELLLDSGALVSLLDKSQSRHTQFVEFFESWDGEVVTSEAVLTEATHLLGRVAGGGTAHGAVAPIAGRQRRQASLSDFT